MVIALPEGRSAARAADALADRALALFRTG
jgi:hypothetical protein